MTTTTISLSKVGSHWELPEAQDISGPMPRPEPPPVVPSSAGAVEPTAVSSPEQAPLDPPEQQEPLQDVDAIQAAVLAIAERERESLSVDNEDPGQGIDSSAILSALFQGEDGDAALYVALHRDILIFDHAAQRWYIFRKHCWEEDLIGEALARVQAVIDLYSLEAKRQGWLKHKANQAGKGDAEQKAASLEKELLKRVEKLHSLPRKKAVLVLAQSGKDSLGKTGQGWDADPWLLACRNGVINLKTGELRPGTPEDMIKTACPTEFKGLDEHAPAWDAFLEATFQGLAEITEYMARLLGYGITGCTTEHVIPIFHGRGRNGKGTLLETVRGVLGPLSFKTKAEALLDQGLKSSGSADADTLAMRGRRLVFASETNEGRRLNAGKLKELTGGDTLNARGVYARYPVEFRPTHLLILMTNSKPRASANDYALWQRLHLIPFNVSFVSNPDPDKSYEQKADPDLPEKLKAEASEILAWLVRGCLAWQKKGLNPPQIIQDATQEYQASEDLISQFLEDCCNANPNSQLQASELYNAYKTWAIESGFKPMANQGFGRELTDRFDRYRNTKGNYYIGLSLKMDSE